MSQPNRNERLGVITAGVIMVVVAAMSLFMRHGKTPNIRPEEGQSVTTTVYAPDTVANDTMTTESSRQPKSKKPKAKRGVKKSSGGPVRDPLSEL